MVFCVEIILWLFFWTGLKQVSSGPVSLLVVGRRIFSFQSVAVVFCHTFGLDYLTTMNGDQVIDIVSDGEGDEAAFLGSAALQESLMKKPMIASPASTGLLCLSLNTEQAPKFKSLDAIGANKYVAVHTNIQKKLSKMGDYIFLKDHEVGQNLVSWFNYCNFKEMPEYEKMLLRMKQGLVDYFMKPIYELDGLRDNAPMLDLIKRIYNTKLDRASVDDLGEIYRNIVAEVQTLGDAKYAFMPKEKIRKVMWCQGSEVYPRGDLYSGVDYAIGLYIMSVFVDFQSLGSSMYGNFLISAIEENEFLVESFIGFVELFFGGATGSKVSLFFSFFFVVQSIFLLLFYFFRLCLFSMGQPRC